MQPRMAAAAGFSVIAAALLTGCQQGQSFSARRAPEFTITAARGIDPGVKLADYRGRWLLIDFWGHW